MELYLKSQIPQARQRLNNLASRALPDLQNLIDQVADMDRECHDAEYKGINIDIYNQDRLILRVAAGRPPPWRTNRQHRQRLALNWYKVGPMMLELITGWELVLCECADQKDKSVLVISVTDRSWICSLSILLLTRFTNTELQRLDNQYCGCGERSARRLSQNKFPSKPIRGSVPFNSYVLQLLHEDLCYCVGWVYSWARGLVSYLQLSSPIQQVLYFYLYVSMTSSNSTSSLTMSGLLEAYHHWRRSQFHFESHITMNLSTSSVDNHADITE